MGVVRPEFDKPKVSFSTGEAWFWVGLCLFVWFGVDVGVSNPDLDEPKPEFDLLDPACGLDFGVANPDLSSQSLFLKW